jgi:hypothetical protein
MKPGRGTASPVTLRDYFAARAPERQGWFVPNPPATLAPAPIYRIGELLFDDWDAAVKHAGFRRSDITTDNEAAIEEWDRRRSQQIATEWPWAWADALLAKRGGVSV